MELTFSPDNESRWISAGSMMFHAHDDVGNPVLVELPLAAWNGLLTEEEGNPLERLRQLSRRGSWEPFGADRVWRIDLS